MPSTLDIFHVAEPQDESRYSHVCSGDKNRFKSARKSDYLVTTFQGDMRILRMLTDRKRPMWSKRDKF